MCGRFVAGRDPASLAAAFGVEERPQRVLPPRYNIAPTQDVYIVRDRMDDRVDEHVDHGADRTATAGEHRVLDIARWGLIPSWAKDRAIGNRMINARAETLADKPAFRSSFAKRRCLVPADGFYEWQAPARAGGRKRPHYLHPADGSILALAGLYAWWRDRSVADDDDPAAWVMSTTLLTTSAAEPVSSIHDRSPVPVAPSLWREWLDPRVPGADVLPQVLIGPPSGYWDIYPVSTAVNSARTDSPDLLAPLVEERLP